MAPIKVYGSLLSTATMRVLICLKEKDLEFEFVPVNMAGGEHKSKDFLKLNPFGQVPALVHGDLKLFESRAITQYLSYEYMSCGTQLVSKESKKMALFGVWMEAEAHQYDVVASKLLWELAYKKKFGMETDQAVVKESSEKLSKVLDVYEARLQESKYLGGDTFGLVDLHHMPSVHYLMATPVNEQFACRPHLSAWAKNILARPSLAKVLEMQ